jgi:hypothetical protein
MWEHSAAGEEARMATPPVAQTCTPAPRADTATGDLADANLANRDSDVERLSRPAKVWRLIALGVVTLLVLGGTLWGQDDDFPFGPFRMYATRDNPNGVVRILFVEVESAGGRLTDVTNASGAPRRAEMEGRISKLRADPELLRPLVPAYTAGIAAPDELRVVWREYRLIDGRSKAPTDVVLASIAVTAVPGGGR